MLEGAISDLQQAARSLLKARSFTFVCVVSLGIGMAPVIAVPYGARALSLPPPGVKTDGLVELVTTRQGAQGPTYLWSYPDFVDLRDANAGITLTGWADGSSEIRTQTPAGVETSSVETLFVSANYFETVGVALARGAGFTAGTAEPVVILAHNFWRTRQGADPAIVGKTIALDGIPYVVAGIAPERFEGHLGFRQADLFMPLEQHPRFRAGPELHRNRGERWVRIHGRLAPGASLEQANAAVSAVTTQLAKQYPTTNEFTAGRVEAYFAAGALERSDVVIIQAAGFTLTGFVLLVVCLNISGMVRVRSVLRERDLSIRQAVGASRARLIRYLLAEALVLAAAGAALASLVLFSIPSLVSWAVGEPLPFQLAQALKIDGSIIGICAAICLATCLAFGLLPAVRFSRPAILSSLKDDVGTGGLRVGRVHRVTAALQVAIAVPLLVMGGITLDRVRATASADLGFAAELLYAAPLKLNPESDAGFQIRSARQQLAQADGVAAVTVADGLPLDFRYRIRRVALKVGPNEAPRFLPVHVTRVDEEYLDTMAIPLLRGRGFTADDQAGTRLVAVISRPLSDELFPGLADPADALGKELTYGADEETQKTLTIIGVTSDFPTSQMSTARAQLLLPLSQYANVRRDSAPITSDFDESPRLMLIARGRPAEHPSKMTGALQNVARQFDPDFSPANVVTGVWLRENSRRDFLTQSSVAGVTGGVVLMLSALGIYGVVGLMVATRTREIAVRVALGATRRRIIATILADVLRLVTPGVAVGVILAVAIVRVNSENMGIALSAIENIAYVYGAAIAILVAVIASLAPARRAASVDPVVAMRSL